MSACKAFNLSDVLTITTGRLVSFRGVEGIYDILSHMTGDSIYTHQIPRAMKAAAPVLLADHPWLTEMGERLVAKIDTLPEGADVMLAIRPLMVEFMQTVGSSDIDILPLDDREWLSVDPVKEAIAIFGEDHVQVVQAP